ncbi:HipA domain-containing protein [Glutamicibacter protophormiae]|uniref:HipA domain-containing protein n=1 Tax=Glutamicibacter protophormiae TaxID=37930 RepID=UPI002A83420F|nr:HipA domain-containing protein [Glutamicibacter protophormiae]WPR66081.1 HipA domain-containing protein [Glutamicibacter protophormiae]WPR69578.1 HipA domain-containing protein [Glutamicibacter protophormiae]
MSIEPSGAEIKCVLVDTEDPDVRWFFKNNTADEQMRYGEDFAEVVSSHLAPLFGVASAQVFFAAHNGIQGIISKDVAPRGHELVHGAAWLPAHGVPNFRRGDKFRKGHSLKNIRESLIGVAAPPNSMYPEELTAFDAFAGMCIFDAWISNQDRHEDNWAVLNPMVKRSDLVARLSPVYDNGSSLAFNVTETKMAEMLNDSANPRIQQWSARAKAHRFERVQPDNRRLGLVEAAEVALHLCTEAGQRHWKHKLSTIDLDQARGIAHEISQMSDVRRKFVNRLLTLNMERIQDVCLSTT